MRWVWRETALWKGRQVARSKFCYSLTCRIIFRISIRARNFCSSLNCLRDWSRNNKKHVSSSTSVSSIIILSQNLQYWLLVGNFGLLHFFEHFEAVPFLLLLANCSLPLHPHFSEYLNYFAFRGLQGEVEGITAGRNADIYVFSTSLSRCRILLWSPSLLQQVLTFFHRTWISFSTTNGKISTIDCFRFNYFILICN